VEAIIPHGHKLFLPVGVAERKAEMRRGLGGEVFICTGKNYRGERVSWILSTGIPTYQYYGSDRG